jgi:hypothetical protein
MIGPLLLLWCLLVGGNREYRRGLVVDGFRFDRKTSGDDNDYSCQLKSFDRLIQAFQVA